MVVGYLSDFDIELQPWNFVGLEAFRRSRQEGCDIYSQLQQGFSAELSCCICAVFHQEKQTGQVNQW